MGDFHTDETIASADPRDSGRHERVAGFDLAEQPLVDVEGELERRYTLGEPIGIGGMGEVLRCRDARIGRDVAMKRLLPGKTAPGLLERFLREARVQGRLQHPAIVPVHDLGVDPEGNPYFVMKRVRGRTLAQILQKQGRGDTAMLHQFNQRTLLAGFARACLALQYAHERGVVHRDLKPSNLMFGDFGELYLLDWGIAKVDGTEDETTEVQLGDVATRGTMVGEILGTLGYASPEQCQGMPGSVGPRADVYAMGVVLFEMLTRRRLMGTRDPHARLDQTLQGVNASPAEIDPSIAPELDAICRRATQLDPDRRYGSMRELHDAVEAYLAGQRSDELRGELADTHARQAEVALAAPLTLDAREGALRDIGRALALGRERTLELFFRVIESPSSEALDAVDAELSAIQHERVRRSMQIGAVNYLAWILLIPLMLWMGVRNGTPLWVAAVSIGMASIACVVFARSGRTGRPALYTVLGLNLIAIAATARVFGPLVIVPQVLLATNFSFGLTDRRVDRIAFALLASLAVLGPLGLELLGLLSPSYAFGPEGMTIVPNALFLPETATLTLLTGITLANLLASTTFCGVVRQEIDRAQGRAVLQAWHLERLFGMGTRPPG